MLMDKDKIRVWVTEEYKYPVDVSQPDRNKAGWAVSLQKAAEEQGLSPYKIIESLLALCEKNNVGVPDSLKNALAEYNIVGVDYDYI